MPHRLTGFRVFLVIASDVLEISPCFGGVMVVLVNVIQDVFDILNKSFHGELCFCNTVSYLCSLLCMLPAAVPFLLLITHALWKDCSKLSSPISPGISLV